MCVCVFACLLALIRSDCCQVGGGGAIAASVNGSGPGACHTHFACVPATTLLSADVHLLNGKHTHIAHCKKKPCRIRVGTRQQGKAGKGKKKDKGKESGEEVVHDDDYDDDYDDADGNKATREGGRESK